MVTVTAAQRADKNPVMQEWVRAKDAENAKEAANNAAMSQQQAAAKAAADKQAAIYAAQAQVFKDTVWGPSGTANGLTPAQNVAAVAAQPKTPVQTVVTKVVDVVKSVVGGGTIVPPIIATGKVDTITVLPALVPTGVLNTNIASVTTDLQKRQNEAGSFTGWDNDSSIRAKQQKDWDIYIATGRWDSPEQIQLHNDAEAMRKAINIMYPGAVNGTPNKAAADALILPDTQPNLGNASDSIFGGIKNAITGATSVTGGQVSSALTLGAFALGTLFVFSMFRGKHH